MTHTDPRARQLAEAVHQLAREKATKLPAWKDLPLSEREKAVTEARLWLCAAVTAGIAQPVPEHEGHDQAGVPTRHKGLVENCPAPECQDRTAERQEVGQSSSGGFTGISLAGRWECGGCGATGDGWYDKDDGLVLHDENGQPFDPDDHVCEED